MDHTLDALVPDFFAPLAPLMNASSSDEAFTSLQSAVQNLGFDKMLFAVMPQPKVNPKDVFMRTTYPSEWRKHYDDQNMRVVDPTVGHCFKSSAPMVWVPQSFQTEAQQSLYEEASSFGLRVGVTLPIHGPEGELGMLTCVRDEAPGQGFLKDLQHNLMALALLRDVAFDWTSKYIRVADAQEKPPVLTTREVDVLQWMTAGKTAWEIGRILSISEAGVNFHISNLRTKFNVSKRNDVVLKAIRMGLVSLPG
jgi:LuxR family quorum-sensing transcriptional regulator LasR